MTRNKHYSMYNAITFNQFSLQLVYNGHQHVSLGNLKLQYILHVNCWFSAYFGTEEDKGDT